MSTPALDLTTQSASPAATRTAAVIVPEWPLLAALDLAQRRAEAAGEEPPDAPTILVARHRVIGCDSAAAQAGVAAGMRQRAARAACPQALVLEQEIEHESSLFELVAAAVDTVAAGVDCLRPGVLLMAARGPARHQGGEEQLAVRIIDAVADLTGWDCSVGIADGPFAALLAARSGRLIHPGRSSEYLAPYSIDHLRHAPVGPGWGHRDQPGTGTAAGGRRWRLEEVIDLLERLGIRTLGDFAQLPTDAVTHRFGPDVAQLHLLSRGTESSPPAAHHPPQPIEAVQVLENPLVRTDQAAFIARPLAEQLQAELVSRGLICTRLRITARTETGQELERTWRHEGALGVAEIVDRIRWQCDGWITRGQISGAAPGAIVQIGLHPVQLMPAGEAAPALWGGAGETAQRASRAFARAQALGGEDAVLVPARTGGRLLREQITLVPWRSEPPAPRRGPWPGSLPRPLPATVFRTPPNVELLDGQDRPVLVTARGVLSAAPVRLRVPTDPDPALSARGLCAGQILPVLSHSAPTILDERWWQKDAQRGARLQMVLGAPQEPASEKPRLLAADPADPAAGGTAVLVLSDRGCWHLEGIYD